jgi:hypothetical protein
MRCVPRSGLCLPIANLARVVPPLGAAARVDRRKESNCTLTCSVNWEKWVGFGNGRHKYTGQPQPTRISITAKGICRRRYSFEQEGESERANSCQENVFPLSFYAGIWEFMTMCASAVSTAIRQQQRGTEKKPRWCRHFCSVGYRVLNAQERR